MANYKIQMKKKVSASTYDNLYPVTRAEYVTGLEKYKMREATDAEYASTTYLNYAKVYFLQKSTDGGTTYTDVVDSNNIAQPILVPKDQFIDSASVSVASPTNPIEYNGTTYTGGENFIKLVFLDSSHSTLYVPISGSGVQVTTYTAGNDGVIVNNSVSPATISHKLGITAQTLSETIKGSTDVADSSVYTNYISLDPIDTAVSTGYYSNKGTVNLLSTNKTYDNYGHVTSITEHNTSAILQFVHRSDSSYNDGEVSIGTPTSFGNSNVYNTIIHATHLGITPTVPTVASTTLSMGSTFPVYYLTSNNQGHITGSELRTFTLPTSSSAIDNVSIVINSNGKMAQAPITITTATATEILNFGGSATCISAITTNTWGHITDKVTKTISIPYLKVGGVDMQPTGLVNNVPSYDLAEYFVRHDINTQGLTNTHKQNARTNIHAVAITVGTTDSSDSQIGDLFFDTTI